MACGIFLSEKLFSYDLILSETLDEGSLQKWFFRSPEEWNRQLWKGIGIPKHYPLSSLPLIQCVINPEGEVTQILYPRQIPNKLEAAIAAQIDAIYNTNR